MSKLYGIVSLLLLMVICMNDSFAGITPEQERAAAAYLSSMTSKHRTPGIQYVFIDADRVLFKYHGGQADLEQKIPVRDDTTFNGYSITKTFTAAAIVKLAVERKIDLDAPLSQYLDDLPYQASPSVRHALQHTAGFPNPNPISWIPWPKTTTVSMRRHFSAR